MEVPHHHFVFLRQEDPLGAPESESGNVHDRPWLIRLIAFLCVGFMALFRLRQLACVVDHGVFSHSKLMTQ